MKTSSSGLDSGVVSHFRRCCRPGCNRPAVATLTYAYSESTAVVGPLAESPDPHSWDLCAEHADKITVPLGWEMLRVDRIDEEDDDDLTALAEAVREAGRGRPRSGLVSTEENWSDPETSSHPVHRLKRVAQQKVRRRGHLHVVPDLEDEE